MTNPKIPTGHKRKGTVTISCPNCAAHLETFSKLAVLHNDAADKLDAYINSLEVAQRDNISSQNTEAEFAARLETQRLELEKSLEAKASVMASRMLASTGVKLSRIPDSDVCLSSSGDGVLDQLDRITDPTEKGKFYRRNEKDIKIAFQHAADKKTQLENQR